MVTNPLPDITQVLRQFTVCYLAVGWYQAHHVWETTYEIHSDKKVGNLRVAVLSDSHTGTTFHGEGFAEHIKEIEAQNPDVLLIAGDFVDDDTSKEDMVRCCQALGEMQTTYGVYYVFGNHDKGYYPPDYRGYDGDDLIAELEKNNVHVMQDDVELVDDRFYIIGRKDKSEEYSGGRKTMEELTKDLDPDKFSIVLDHQPQDYDAQAASGVDLVLSGHTHGGQVSLFKRWTPAGNFSKYGSRFLTGLKHNSQGIPVIISNGLGTSRKDIRLFTPSEVVLVILHCGPEKP